MARTTQQGSVRSQEAEASQEAAVQEAQAAPQAVATVQQPAGSQISGRKVLVVGAIVIAALAVLGTGARSAGLFNRSLPVTDNVDATTWFSGDNLVTVTSHWPRRLTIDAALRDYQGNTKETKQFVLSGNGDTASLGWWQGWNLEDGDSIVLSHPRFRSRSISFDNVLAQRGSAEAEDVREPENTKNASGPVASIW